MRPCTSVDLHREETYPALVRQLGCHAPRMRTFVWTVRAAEKVGAKGRVELSPHDEETFHASCAGPAPYGLSDRVPDALAP
jgi:hypothetical protein